MFNNMIKTIFFIFILLFLSTDGRTQTVDSTAIDSTKRDIKFTKEQNDSTVDKNKTAKADKKKKSQLEENPKGFIDKNANGIDDRLEGKNAKKGKQKGKKDLFIDRNGDGICDGQESVFGLKKALRKQKRTKGKGR